MTQLRKFILLAAVFLISGCASKLEQNYAGHSSEKCQDIRAAMDVGSGSTKIKVALVDTCEPKILKVIKEDQVAIAFKENIGSDGNLPSTFMNEASDKIVALADQAVRNGVPANQIALVATQAARDARNIEEFKKLLSNQNLSLTVITQQEEAELGHQAAGLASRLKSNEFTSFDIGGGSFQLVNETGPVKMIGGHLASVSFKNHVLTKIQNRTTAQSPNPIREKHAATAIKYASDYASRLASSTKGFEVKKKVVGIGGVFGNSIRNQLRLAEADPVNTAVLEKEIPKLIRRTSKDLVGPFADTESTNLLLVLGLMKGLGIKEVHVFKANLTDGVLINSQFFRRVN